MRGLERQSVLATSHDAAVGLALHAVLGQPRRNGGRETERDDHHVRFQERFAALDRHRVLAAIGIGLAEAGLDHGHADHFVIGTGFNRQRLAVEQETHALLARVGHFARAAGHVRLVAAVGAGHLGRAQAHRAAHAVHAGVAAAEHHHALAVEVGQGDGVFPAGNRPAVRIIATDDAAVLHQERQRRQHALQVLAVEAAIGVAVGAGAQEHRVMRVQQLLQADVTADLHAQAELHAHAFEHLAAATDHVLVQLEAGNAKLQQATNLLVAVVDHGSDAGMREAVGTGQAGRAGTDHRHRVAGGLHGGHVRPPAGGQRGIDDVLLYRADGHCAELLQRAAAFAQPVLRADPAAHFRQRVGAVAQGGRFMDAVFLHQLQPLRNGVVHRALPAAVGVAAIQAAAGLVLGVFLAELAVQLTPVAGGAQFDRDALRHGAGQVEELEGVLAAHGGLFDVFRLPASGRHYVILGCRPAAGTAVRRRVAGFRSATRCWRPSV